MRSHKMCTDIYVLFARYFSIEQQINSVTFCSLYLEPRQQMFSPFNESQPKIRRHPCLPENWVDHTRPDVQRQPGGLLYQ